MATVALTGLAAYNRDVVDSGTRNVLAAATAEERSVLVRASAGRTDAALRDLDGALRQRVEADLAGLPARVSAAGYAAGRQLRGDTGEAVADRSGVTYASVMFLDDLPAHARLTSGTWPRTGADPVQTAIGEAAATTLRVGVGDRIPITDGLTGRVTEVVVTGVFSPVDPDAAYWRLAPETSTGSLSQAATYGPMTVSRDDFATHFLANASAGWLVEPDLTGIGPTALDRLADAAARITTSSSAAAGLGDSAVVSGDLVDLVQRLRQATLVGRSALVTPMLLVVVLGGYALLLVAILLTEHRRGETALLRARGAARWQVAGLTAREATLVVLPAVVLAPPLVVELLGLADRLPGLAAVSLRPDRADPTVWLVAGLAAAGCAAAMIGPSLRRGDSYVADLASRSRPNRRGMVQRASLDVLLVGLALLSWYQLSRYSSPLSRSRGGELGVDPLLAAAPTLGVLAGAVLALRLLPPLVRPAADRDHRCRPCRVPGRMMAVDAGRRIHRSAARRLAEARVPAPATVLPTGTRRLTGQLRTRGVVDVGTGGPIRHEVVLSDARGEHRRVVLGSTGWDGQPLRFSVELPAGDGPWRLAGFTTETRGGPRLSLDWRLSDLRASPDTSTGTPVDLGADGPWQVVDRAGTATASTGSGATLSGRYARDMPVSWNAPDTPVQLAVTRPAGTNPVPVVATAAALDALHVDVGAQTRLFLGGAEVDVVMVDRATALPGDVEDAALLVDLPSLRTRLFHEHGIVRSPQEWWVAAQPGAAAQVAGAAATLDGLTVLDRRDVATSWLATRSACVAALAAVLLAAVGVAVDVSARRGAAGELAVLHTLGAGHRLVARSLLAEQSFLAGMGVLVGLAVGVGVAATMAPLVILTPSADRPDPPPLLSVDWVPVLGTGIGLLALALAFSAAVSVSVRRRLTAAHLRAGEAQ